MSDIVQLIKQQTSRGKVMAGFSSLCQMSPALIFHMEKSPATREQLVSAGYDTQKRFGVLLCNSYAVGTLFRTKSKQNIKTGCHRGCITKL